MTILDKIRPFLPADDPVIVASIIRYLAADDDYRTLPPNERATVETALERQADYAREVVAEWLATVADDPDAIRDLFEMLVGDAS